MHPAISSLKGDRKRHIAGVLVDPLAAHAIAIPCTQAKSRKNAVESGVSVYASIKKDGAVVLDHVDGLGVRFRLLRGVLVDVVLAFALALVA